MATASVLVAGLISMPVSGQSGKRGIIVKRRENGKTDGLHIRISKYDGPQPVFVDPTVPFKTGDEIRVSGDSASSTADDLHGKDSKRHLEDFRDSNGGGIVTDNVVPPDGVQTRDIRRVTVTHPPTSSASPRRRQRNEEKESVVAIAYSAAKGPRLKSGEVAVFELRLEHF